MKKKLTLLVILVAVCAVSAQTTFEFTYGDSDYSEFGRSVITTPDGGYIVAGGKFHHLMYSDDHGFLLKVDPWGQPEWEKKYGARETRTELSDVVVLNHSGYLLLGYHAGGGIFTIRVDARGDTVWARQPVTPNFPYYAHHLEKSGPDFVFAAAET